ncbi:TPA: DUF4065 domain-containing protein [Streptococcus pyogenes]|uniref:Panacea domain-containing protein n=1 Tax=Streptococcus pyogenes TaxID=1314 RepID=UPI0010C37E16|nr:type II toxin-antitoxin system antitoxin SocA domain-containing protein [Streptococcus pyogenes]QBX14797.1 GepA protein [Streptococcus phage Javan157]QBX28835.1 GepA protein [Streptococcus phage Javan470]VGQ96110.1 phage-associated protein [Streptococcus pyogenes]VGR09601.1 phage-associated protein [Streptococcus pyogenes]VGR09617.1 phage-associated protein [Streptococcus pyogenes]
MITALDVANTFLVRAKNENIDISPMKLQKLIYILYKVYLKETKKRLFAEKFEVWKYGPVISDVYQVFKKYRSNKISDFYKKKDGSYTTVKLNNNPKFDKVFAEVWDKYSRVDGIYLSQLTHQKDTAWSKADERNDYFLNDNEIFEESEYEIGA